MPPVSCRGLFKSQSFQARRDKGIKLKAKNVWSTNFVMSLQRVEYKLLQYENSAQVEQNSKSDVQLENGEQKEDLLCKQCLQKITSVKAKTAVQGQHKHIFFNPQGLVFEIGCFYSAWGYVLLGSATREFSWFDGYAWQIMLCSNCLIHLGWSYMSANDGFYGLILQNLVSGTVKEN